MYTGHVCAIENRKQIVYFGESTIYEAVKWDRSSQMLLG